MKGVCTRTVMKAGLRASLATVMLLSLSTGRPLHAQQDSSKSAQAPSTASQDSSQNTQDSPKSAEDKPPEAVTRPNADSYAVSLGTGELINLNGVQQNANSIRNADPNSQGEYVDGMRVKNGGKQLNGRLFYGLSAASTYVDSVSGVGIPAGVGATVVPYIALLEPTRTGSYLLQYSATVAPNDLYSGDTEVFHAGGARIQGALSRRWFWTIAESVNYGSDLARLEAPLTFVAVQSTPVVDAGSTAVLVRAHNVAFVESMARLDWWKSLRETIGFAVTHTYTHLDGDPGTPLSTGSSSNTLGVKGDYNRTISNRLSLRAYGEADTRLGSRACESFGGGLGLGVRVNQKVGFDLEGGPQFNTGGCGGSQSANFRAALTVNLTNKERFYLSAIRQFSTAYQTNGVWEDSIAAGFAKVMGRFTLSTDSGYLHADQLSSLVEPYYGYFVAPRLSMRISESLSCSAAYRNFHGFGGGVGSGNLSLSVFSLEWHPASIHVK